MRVRQNGDGNRRTRQGGRRCRPKPVIAALANELDGADSGQMCRDMDAWGYTFRLGSAQAWFEQDADDARRWLLAHRIIDEGGRITGTCRLP